MERIPARVETCFNFEIDKRFSNCIGTLPNLSTNISSISSKSFSFWAWIICSYISIALYLNPFQVKSGNSTANSTAPVNGTALNATAATVAADV